MGLFLAFRRRITMTTAITPTANNSAAMPPTTPPINVPLISGACVVTVIATIVVVFEIFSPGKLCVDVDVDVDPGSAVRLTIVLGSAPGWLFVDVDVDVDEDVISIDRDSDVIVIVVVEVVVGRGHLLPMQLQDSGTLPQSCWLFAVLSIHVYIFL